MDSAKVLASLRTLVIVVDGAGRILHSSGDFAGMLGYSSNELVDHQVLEFMNPTDHAEVAEYFAQAASDPLFATTLPGTFRASIITRNGSILNVDVIATGLLDDPDVGGWVLSLVPHQLQTTSHAPLEAFMAGEPIGKVYRLLAQQLTDAPPHIWQWCLIPSGDHVEPVAAAGTTLDPFISAISALDEPNALLGAHTALADARVVPLMDLPAAIGAAVTHSGFTSVIVAPVIDDGEPIAHLVGLSRQAVVDLANNHRQLVNRITDLTGLVIRQDRSTRQLIEAATRDTLTGLANRDSFEETLAGFDEVPFSLIYVDVDHFKEVNDRFGHVVGDRVLETVAERINSSCRPEDTAARIGGDEFAVIVRSPHRTTALEVGDRILARMSEPLGIESGPSKVSVSIGLATCDSIPSGSAVAAADLAMLEAKRAGRDRLAIA